MLVKSHVLLSLSSFRWELILLFSKDEGSENENDETFEEDNLNESHKKQVQTAKGTPVQYRHEMRPLTSEVCV